MTRREFAKVARPELLEELRVAGFSPTVGEEGRPRLILADETTWIEATDAELPGIEQVVNAHNPAAYAAAEDDRLARYREDKQRLRDFLAAANTSISLLALVAVVKSLIRVLMHKFREMEGDE